MIHPVQHIALLAATLVAVAINSATIAASGAATGCAARTVCDHRLGVSIPLQPGWVRLRRVPASEVDLAVPGAGDEGYIRLVIRAFEDVGGDAKSRGPGSGERVGRRVPWLSGHGSSTTGFVRRGSRSPLARPAICTPTGR